MAGHALSRAESQRLLELLDEELRARDVLGELYLVGGAVMCLALNAREATRDVDAFFRPTAAIREAAKAVARRADVPPGWLNDAVKGYLGEHGEYDAFLELPNLRVYVARPEYLLALKSMAMRIGAEFADVDDVRYLLRYLNITSADQAIGIVSRYFDADSIPLKTRLALEELLPSIPY